MKRLLTILLLVISYVSFGQSYQVFNKDSTIFTPQTLAGAINYTRGIQWADTFRIRPQDSTWHPIRVGTLTVNPTVTSIYGWDGSKWNVLGGGSGSNQTWQQTLDVGSILDKDNYVNGTAHYFAIDSINMQIIGRSRTNDTAFSLFTIADNTIDLGSGDTTIATHIATYYDSAVIRADTLNIAEGWNFTNGIVVTPSYVSFNKYFRQGVTSTLNFNPKIVYAPDTLLTEPEYIAAFDNDTIKKYPFSGSGGSSLFPLTGTGTATGNVTGELDGNTLTVESGGRTFLTINPETGNEFVSFMANNTTDDGNTASVQAGTSATTSDVAFVANFNDGAKVGRIIAHADASESTITHDADRHIFNGNTVFANNGTPDVGRTLHAIDANGNWLWDTLIYKDDTKGWVAINKTTPSALIDAYPLSYPGTVATTNGSPTVTGTNTRFQNQFKAGDSININGTVAYVSSVASQTSLTLTANFGATQSGVTYFSPSSQRGVFKVDEAGRFYQYGKLIGYIAPYDNFESTAWGYGALATDRGGFNSAFGYKASSLNTTGVNNIAIGALALRDNTTGSSNAAIGVAALLANTAGGLNTAIGTQSMAGQSSPGDLNTGISAQSLYNNTGSNNIGIGYQTLFSNSGSSNVAIGNNSMQSNSSGARNTSIGEVANYYNTTGDDNTAIGYAALSSFGTARTFNTAIGSHAGDSTNASNSVYIGYYAGYKNRGNNNTYIGYTAQLTYNATNSSNYDNVLYMTNKNGGDSTVSTTGKVGILKNNPSYTLDVNGVIGTNKPIATSGTTPSYSLGTGAGTGATASITGNDASGYITINTGTSPTAAADIITVTFSTALTNTPTSIILTPGNGFATLAYGKLFIQQSSVSSSSWKMVLSGGQSLTASSTYIYYYHVYQ